MATSFALSPSQLHVSNVQDDIFWTEYLKLASDTDARLVKDWTKVIDDLLVFVALFSGVLTAFIIQTSANFQPPPGEVTNKILIAIYRHTMNVSTPIDLEQFLRLDGTSKSRNDLHSWLLYLSLAFAILVAALAMAAKLWLDRYSREVTTTLGSSESPRARAKRRQEVYDGLVAWRMERCIDAMPVMALIALFLFALFIHSSVSVEQKIIGYAVGSVFLIGISYLLVASFSAAFIVDSPFRSPFSDFVNIIFRVFPSKPVPGFRQVLWRTVGIILTSSLVLAAGGYLILKQNYFYFVCVFYAIASVFALMRKGRETDMRPRFFSLPGWVFISCITVAIGFSVSSTLAKQNSKLSCIIVFVLGSILLFVHGYFGVKMSEKKPMTVEADAISWVLKTSYNKDPAWFQKAVQIAERSPNVRALLVWDLLPLLLPLITSSPKYQQGGDAMSEQEGYISALAILLDFAPGKRSFRRNEARLERPTLPKELIDTLEELQGLGEECSHCEGNLNQKKWHDGTVQCPKGCISNAVEHILQLHESDTKKLKSETV